MTVYPQIAVNGIAMDDPAGRWAIRRDQGLRSLPGIRSSSITVPGRTGALWTAYEPHDVNTFTLSLFVVGQGADRFEKAANLEANLEAIFFLVSQTPVELTYTLQTNEERSALCRVVPSTTPTYVSYEVAQVDFIFEMPDVYWRDADFTEVSNLTPDLTYPPWREFALSELSGATAPLSDMELILTGPFTKFDIVGGRVIDGVLDASVTTRLIYTGTISSSASLYIDCGNMRAYRQFVTDPSWDGVDKGVDETGNISASGVESATNWLKLWPDASGGTFSTPGDRKLYLTMRAQGATSATRFRLRAKRAFL